MNKTFNSVSEMCRNLGREDLAKSVESLPQEDIDLAGAMAAFSNGEADKEQQLMLGKYFGGIIEQLHAAEDRLLAQPQIPQHVKDLANKALSKRANWTDIDWMD